VVEQFSIDLAGGEIGPSAFPIDPAGGEIGPSASSIEPAVDRPSVVAYARLLRCDREARLEPMACIASRWMGSNL
jgi:hypothetical protein